MFSFLLALPPIANMECDEQKATLLIANWRHHRRDVTDGERSCGTRPALSPQPDFANNDLSHASRNMVSAVKQPPATSGKPGESSKTR